MPFQFDSDNQAHREALSYLETAVEANKSAKAMQRMIEMEPHGANAEARKQLMQLAHDLIVSKRNIHFGLAMNRLAECVVCQAGTRLACSKCGGSL